MCDCFQSQLFSQTVKIKNYFHRLWKTNIFHIQKKNLAACGFSISAFPVWFQVTLPLTGFKWHDKDTGVEPTAASCLWSVKSPQTMKLHYIFRLTEKLPFWSANFRARPAVHPPPFHLTHMLPQLTFSWVTELKFYQTGLQQQSRRAAGGPAWGHLRSCL